MTLAERLHIPEKTVRDQRRAADPCASAWVSANAGAGKTKVLTDRVVRLLLAGAPPGRILCLTFTKAAAATMAIRVFERLGRWVTLDDDALGAELAELEGGRPSPEHLRRARRLFARAVETPGGLKIETIHAFCERILHLVPFEAGVPARFTVLDESEVEELIAQATADVLGEAATDESPRLAAAFGTLSLDAVGDALSQVIAAAVREVACGRARGKLSESVPELRRTLGLAPHETPAEIERAMLEDGLAPVEWTALATALQPSKAKTDQGTAATLLRAVATSDPAERLLLVRALFFTEKGERRVTLCTQAAGPSIAEALLAEQHRLAGL